jgi:cysteinyl-tRNA synthetase
MCATSPTLTTRSSSARWSGITIRQLTDEMIAAMHQDIGALGIERPGRAPRHRIRAADAVADRPARRQGPGLRSPNGDVNYSVRKFAGYGKLSGKSLDELRAGERVAVQDGKEDPLDFVLWNPPRAGEPPDAKWDSPFGAGRPGWHIECSAMSCATLGETFDIHGGGADLQFPHHENEIAQSEGATGKPLARFWVHNGFVRVDNEKMSKSLGNFFTIRDVLKQYDAETVRFFIVRAHYRSAAQLQRCAPGRRAPGAQAPVHGAEPGGASQRGHRLGRAPCRTLQGRHGRRLWHARGRGRAVRSGQRSQQDPLCRTGGPAQGAGGCLGLLQGDPQAFLQAGAGLDEAAIQAQIAARAAAKAARTLPRPTASAMPCWPRASCSRTRPPARPGKLHSDFFECEIRPRQMGRAVAATKK